MRSSLAIALCVCAGCLQELKETPWGFRTGFSESVFLSAGEGDGPEDPAGGIEAHIARLGSEDWFEREKAEAALMGMGERVVDRLSRYPGGDAEIAMRIGRIRAAFLRPKWTDETGALVKAYYDNEGVFAGEYVLECVVKARIDAVCDGVAALHVRYKYRYIAGNAATSDREGIDERIFYLDVKANRVFDMDEHMSAVFDD